MCEAGRLVQTTVKRGHRYDGRKDRVMIVKLFESVAIEGVACKHAFIVVTHRL